MYSLEINLFGAFLFAIAFYMIGWYSREWYAVRILKKLLGNASKNITQNGVMTVNVKKACAGFDVFDAKDDKFLANVSSKQEMIDFFKSNFPDTVVVMNRENSKVFDESL